MEGGREGRREGGRGEVRRGVMPYAIQVITVV